MANPQKLWVQSKQVLDGVAEIFGKPVPVQDGMVIDLGEGLEIR